MSQHLGLCAVSARLYLVRERGSLLNRILKIVLSLTESTRSPLLLRLLLRILKLAVGLCGVRSGQKGAKPWESILLT
jgi:hypothetical protein